MKVILKETIESLGLIGSEVKVARGFARNYLLPRNKALLATPENRKMIEQRKAKLDLQIAKEQKIAEEMAQRLEGVTCKISAKVTEENKLYGSVAILDIINALESQGIKVEKNSVLLKEPIKLLGTYKVPIRVYKNMKPEIIVEVVSAA
ncbi:MAG: 50S ribosomal protein L9 [Desulfobacterales bacterium]|nr:50S ribosomal protein L9 [Desulfobacterales bacterium]MBF0398269.1 50S ribosomal protein L9 [Desulfobacterales bacterium]